MRTKVISMMGRSARNLSGRARKKDDRGREKRREGGKLTEVPDDKITRKLN